MRMPQAAHAERGGEIEESVAVRVPHIRSRGALPKDREIFRQVRHIPRLVPAQLIRQLPRVGPGNGGDDFGEQNSEGAGEPVRWGALNLNHTLNLSRIVSF